jgi:hypothetical protein
MGQLVAHNTTVANWRHVGERWGHVDSVEALRPPGA